MFSKGPIGGKKLSASPDCQNKQGNMKKKGLTRLARRYALHLGTLLVLAAFVLAAVIQPAKAGSYTVTPSGAATVTAQSMSGTPATDMDSDDNSTYTAFKEKSSTKALDFDITMDPVVAQAGKIYKVSLSIDALITAGFDNVGYYAKMYTGSTSTQDFGTAYLGTFSTTDGTNDTVTLVETDILKAQAFYNGAIANVNQPKVKIQNARTYNGTTDNTQSEISIDYLTVTFYEDINLPTAGALSPTSAETDVTPLRGTAQLTLSNVQDNASPDESGMKEVQFYRSPYNQNNWTLIATDTTPDASNNYSVTWDSTQVIDEYYDLKAVAVDKVSNQREVLSTHLRVQNADVTPPTNVSITSPTHGSKVNSPTIVANAQDDVGVTKMEFYDSTNPSAPFAVDTSSVGGWIATWDTSNTGTYVEGQSYEVWVKAFDAANNSTTSAGPNKSYVIDRIAPTVQSTDPVNNSTNIPSNRPPLQATFSEVLDWSTVTTTTFTLNGDVSGSITGTVSVDDPTRTATFTPDGDLTSGEWFTARLTTAVKDQAGNTLASEYTWRFQTIDTSSPVVSTITPGDGTSLKLESREITAVAIDNVAVTKVEFWWRDINYPATWTKFGEDTIPGDGWKATLNTATFTSDGQYDIKALAYDAAGNPPGELMIGYNVDKTPPLVNSVLPANGTTNVSRAPTISAAFSEEIDPATLIEDITVYLTRFGSFEIINMNMSYNPMTKTVTMVMPFGSYLNYDTTYLATVTVSVADLAGNTLSIAKTWSFTTEIDLIPPKATVTDVDNSFISPTNVDGTKDNVEVTYNLDQESTVHLEVFDAVGDEVYSSLEQLVIAGNGHIINWNGRDNLGLIVPDGTYTLKIIAVDLSGNIGRAKVKPNIVVDNSSPWARTAVAESRTKIKLTFSEPMDINSSTNKFYYTVTEKDNPAVTLAVSQVSMVDQMTVRIETTDQQKTDMTQYTIRVENVEDSQGNQIQSPTDVDFTGFTPHGLYAQESSLCANCHQTHAGQGKRLINQTNLKSQCYICHGTGKQSTFNTVYSDLNAYSHHPVEQFVNGGDTKISCDDCHNVHGEEKTPGVLYPKLLQAKKTAGGQKYREGNEYCFVCHGSDSTLRDPYGDKQTYYPLDGVTHNSSALDPAGGTGIRCQKCHASHGSALPKLLRPQINSLTVTGNNRTLCYTCHSEAISFIDRSWNGQAIYDSAGNAHSGQQCGTCHDPHTTENGNFQINTYDTNYSVNRSAYYNAADYQTCNGSCHIHENTLNTNLTKTTKDNPDDPAPTAFWDEVMYDAYPDDPRVNLHDFHLNMNLYRPGKGNATCKECHRPHGPLSAENPTLERQVGFPATTVTANVYATPRWTLETTESGHKGSCFLNCHGKEHNGTLYDHSGPAASSGGDSSCYSCHQTGAIPVNIDIQSLMGDDLNPPAGINSRHIVSNVSSDLAGGNGCMTKCHEPHSTFDARGKASNTLLMDWDDVAKIMSNDQNLCQNCHKNSPSPGAAAVTEYFPNTAHGNYQAVYHDYGAGETFKANCLKCHSPHGSDTYNLLDFENQGQEFGRDSVTISNGGKDNSACLACHTTYRGPVTTPNWPGNTLYSHGNNAHGISSMTWNGSSANGYCLSCHDPHGINDGAGIIPDFLRAKGPDSCYACHNGTSGTIPDWPGSASYDLPSAHKTSVNDGTHLTGYCENCHAVHGKDDGAGNPVPELLYPKETGKANSCFNNNALCHGSPAAASNNIETIYTGKTYKHGDLTSQGHLSTEKDTGPGWLPATNRHAECEDCHNSHAAKATTTPTTLSDGNVKDSEVGVWGITLKDGGNNPIDDPSNPALWPAGGQAPANANIVVIDNSVKEWQICAKCHSAWAYGASKPTAAKWDGTSDPGGQTDVLADFNPNNQGHHAVIAQGKNQPGAANANFANTFVGLRWGPGARVACSDCHASDLAADARGTHGSNFRYLLVKNTSGSGDAAVFCLNCHQQSVYGDPATTSPPNASWSRFTHPENGAHIIASTNTSNNHASGIWCLNCHMGDATGGSHGSNRGIGAQGNQPVGKRLMNGAAIIGIYDDGALGGTCFSQGSKTTQNALSACTKGHSQGFSFNYNY